MKKKNKSFFDNFFENMKYILYVYKNLNRKIITEVDYFRKPEITSHVVDDVFLRTITEKKTIEDIERHKRLVTEYRQVPHVPQFDVTIRNHTQPEAQWENFSDISSASGMTLTPKMERVPLSLPPQKFIG